MACAYQNTTTLPCVENGDTFLGYEWTITVNSAPLDLTGATIVMRLEGNRGTLTTVGSGGLTITDAANGVFEIDKQIISFLERVHGYEVEFTLADGTVKTYIVGTWEIV